MKILKRSFENIPVFGVYYVLLIRILTHGSHRVTICHPFACVGIQFCSEVIVAFTCIYKNIYFILKGDYSC